MFVAGIAPNQSSPCTQEDQRPNSAFTAQKTPSSIAIICHYLVQPNSSSYDPHNELNLLFLRLTRHEDSPQRLKDKGSPGRSLIQEMLITA